MAAVDQCGDAEDHQDGDLDAGHDPLGVAGDPDADQHQERHDQEGGGADADLGPGVVGQAAAEEREGVVARRERARHHEDGRRDHQRPAGQEAERGVQRAADPGVAGAGVDVQAAQVVEGPGDAEHGDGTPEQGGRADQAGRAGQQGSGGSQRVSRGTAREGHDDGVEATENIGPEATGPVLRGYVVAQGCCLSRGRRRGMQRVGRDRETLVAGTSRDVRHFGRGDAGDIRGYTGAAPNSSR